jgi:hypothetical protein
MVKIPSFTESLIWSFLNPGSSAVTTYLSGFSIRSLVMRERSHNEREDGVEEEGNAKEVRGVESNSEIVEGVDRKNGSLKKESLKGSREIRECLKRLFKDVSEDAAEVGLAHCILLHERGLETLLRENTRGSIVFLVILVSCKNVEKKLFLCAFK